MKVDITIQVDLDVPSMTDAVYDALQNLGDVMAVQAEDGLYALGSPDSILDGKPNDHIADITMCTVESIAETVPQVLGDITLRELRMAQPGALLQTFAALTHQMHALGSGDATAVKRQMRDMVEEEILLRIRSTPVIVAADGD